MNDNKWYVSSSGDGLSWTIGGLSITGLAPFVATLLPLVGVEIAENEAAEIMQAIGVAFGSVVTLCGLLRKVYFRVAKKTA